MPPVPYSAKDNPFRANCIERLQFRWGTTSPDKLLCRMRHRGFCGAIIGPKGVGKTSLLDQLIPRLTSEGRPVRRKRLSTDTSRIGRAASIRSLIPPEGCFLVVDGFDLLPRPVQWAVRTLTERASGLLITAHRPVFGVPTLHHQRSSLPVLHDLCKELVPEIAWEAAWLLPLFSRHQGNIREVFGELYDIWAEESSSLTSCPIRQTYKVLSTTENTKTTEEYVDKETPLRGLRALCG